MVSNNFIKSFAGNGEESWYWGAARGVVSAATTGRYRQRGALCEEYAKLNRWNFLSIRISCLVTRGAHFKKKFWWIWLSDTFSNNFCKNFRNVPLIKIGLCPLTHRLCPACLLNFTKQASLAELPHQAGLPDQKIKKGTFIRVEKISFWESPIKICDVVGTPISYASLLE